MNELAGLKPGWLDGDGKAITGAALQTVRSIIRILHQIEYPLPLLFPSPEGGICAEWHDIAGIDRGIDIRPDGNTRWYWMLLHTEIEKELDIGAEAVCDKEVIVKALKCLAHIDEEGCYDIA